MARPMPTTINCPNCGQPFNALLEQVLDVGTDPSAKERLLSGEVNRATCPHCGWSGAIGTPLMYHDPSKSLAIVHVPMQIDMGTEEREKLIGSMTTAVMNNLPEGAPRGYLLQPQTALTLQGLIEQVLEADGITRDVLDRERKKVEVINELASSPNKEHQAIIDENMDLIDETFFQLLTEAAQSASQNGQQRESLRLLNVRSHLMETTEVGATMKAREEAVNEVMLELQAAVNDQGQISREAFVDIVVDSADSAAKIAYLAMAGQQLLDYETFSELTRRAEAESDPERRSQIEEARETFLEVAEQYEEESRAVVEQLVNVLRSLMAAPDLPGAVRSVLSQMDQQLLEVFMQVLQVNLEEARRSGNVEASSKLKEIRDEVLKIVQESAPPEVQLINELLSVPTEEESLAILNEHAAVLTPQFIEVMSQLITQLQAVGNDAAVDRLRFLKTRAEEMV